MLLVGVPSPADYGSGGASWAPPCSGVRGTSAANAFSAYSRPQNASRIEGKIHFQLSSAAWTTGAKNNFCLLTKAFSAYSWSFWRRTYRFRPFSLVAWWFGRSVLSQPTTGFERASWVSPTEIRGEARPQTHFLHMLGHRKLLVERKQISFSVKFSIMSYWSNNNFAAVQSYERNCPDCPPWLRRWFIWHRRSWEQEGQVSCPRVLCGAHKAETESTFFHQDKLLAA